MHHVDRKLIVIMPGIRCPGYIACLVGYIQGGGRKTSLSPPHRCWKFGPTNHRMDLGGSVHPLTVWHLPTV